MPTIASVLKVAASLSQADFAELLKKLQALNSVSSKSKVVVASIASYEVVLYEAIAKKLRISMPATKFFKLPTSAYVVSNLEKVVKQIRTIAPNMTRTEIHSVLELVASLTVEFVRHHKYPTQWIGVTAALSDLNSLFDTQFPGYASNNLLQLVFKLHTAKRTSHSVWNKSTS